jgi:ABC-2 type transport system ATP-binding protein
MTSGQPLAVNLRGLTKRYGELTAVRDLSMAIESGEIVAFLGPNGAGKTNIGF